MSTSQLPFTSTSFPNSVVDFPDSTTLVEQNTSTVTIITSDGVTRQVFDSPATGSKCLNYMRQRKQYYMQISDELMLINCETKLLILETTFLNQKLMNSFVFTYFNNEITGIHRNLSTMMNLTQALVSVGYKKTTTTDFNTNADLETNLTQAERPYIKVFDYYYGIDQGSKLKDVTQLVLGNFADSLPNTT